MRLTRLELHGFKSFADSTTLVFEPGVTAIVGPNGCGKSNVSDAVRWVLGEQRARALRGAKMDEVIFQGSSARRPVSVAEVSLHFDNDEGLLPVAYREVVITRRLSRSGESEYLLNRAPCRLRDIHDLMRGTGLGADAGVVIESRMIDALLSDRPDDRRELFEEAAGIGLYRDRRRTTERRLEETTLDLARLDDLVSEVQTQVRSLARQRRRAERHVELTSRRFAVELTIAVRDLEHARIDLGSLDTTAEALRARQPQTAAAAGAAEQQRDSARRDRAAAEAQRSELARLSTTLQQQVSALHSEIAVAEERQRNASQRRQRAEDERRAGEAAGSRMMADRETAAQEHLAEKSASRAAADVLADRATQEHAAREALGIARQAADAVSSRVRELRDAVAHLDIERAAGEREHTELSQRLTALASEREALEDREIGARRGVAAAQDAESRADEELRAATASHTAVRDEATAAREAEAEAHRVLARAEAALAEVEEKVQALERLERERVGLAPGAARLLAVRQQFGEGAILGPLSDFVSTRSADAGVIERYLGPTVHAVVVRDRGVADAVRQWHAAADPGPLCLLPLDGAGGLSTEGVAPDRASALAERVTPAPAAAGWVRTLLGRVSDLGGGVAFEDGVGAIWLPGTPAGQGPLRRRAELENLSQERGESAARRDSAAQRALDARAALADVQARAASAADAAATAEQVARRAREQRTEAEGALDRASRDARLADEVRDRLSARMEVLTARMNSIAEQRAHTEAELEETLRAEGDARGALVESERLQEVAREARTAAQIALAQTQAREQVAADRRNRLEAEHLSATGRLDALRAELETLSSTDRELAERLAAWRIDVTSREAAARDADARLGSADDAVQRFDAVLATAEQALDTARLEGASIADELHTVELRRIELGAQQRAVREKLEAEWQRPWDTLIAELSPLEIETAILRAEAVELREQLTALGPVNALAVEEHEEETKRLEFLTTQRADLASAKGSLQHAIREIDATARELFLDTFSQVRENFRQIFMTLFGGGECDLRLENPDVPLESDIEIHASPRGKRTQRIHLLSSGERALVALSLLFGIFLTKPSPFCLLDEVDAPLDDQNIGRFVHMLNEFKARTQFIIITHNPRTTTEAADAVYGVTMQEPGISSVVSVRLQGRALTGATADADEDASALQEV